MYKFLFIIIITVIICTLVSGRQVLPHNMQSHARLARSCGGADDGIDPMQCVEGQLVLVLSQVQFLGGPGYTGSFPPPVVLLQVCGQKARWGRVDR